jgi:hypothetical protein
MNINIAPGVTRRLWNPWRGISKFVQESGPTNPLCVLLKLY